MKLLIVTLNSKYTHTSLAVRCLYNAVKDMCDAAYAEYTINDNLESVTSDIFAHRADCIAFSCYIWNIESVLKIASVIKKASPKTRLVFGGHEVEHDSTDFLKKNLQADAVLRGEGEISLKEYVEVITGKKDISSACRITYRDGENIVFLPDGNRLADLNELPFVYDDSIEDIKNRIIYYETSRGCPYNCSYCLSGEGHKVRFLETERVKKELKFFMDRKVPLVKLVDRTFNADINRAKEIFRFIAENLSDTCFHMELSGDLLDEETLDILSRVKKGSLQFEIGVQTTNTDTIKAINRRVSSDKLKSNVLSLLKSGNIHIHLDLIAGLPGENMDSFKNSFNEVLSLRPHVLQLGFLKMLKGSKIRKESETYGYIYRDYPPYEVIANDFMTYDNFLELKVAEDALDKYYNSGSFKYSISYLMNKTDDLYSIFSSLGNYIKENFATGYAFSKKVLFDIMFCCFKDLGEDFLNELKIDYLINIRPGVRPYWLGENSGEYTKPAYRMFKDENLKKERFPFYYDVPAKEIMKYIYVEKTGDKVLAFDHKRNDIYDISDCIGKYFGQNE